MWFANSRDSQVVLFLRSRSVSSSGVVHVSKLFFVVAWFELHYSIFPFFAS